MYNVLLSRIIQPCSKLALCCLQTALSPLFCSRYKAAVAGGCGHELFWRRWLASSGLASMIWPPIKHPRSLRKCQKRWFRCYVCYKQLTFLLLYIFPFFHTYYVNVFILSVSCCGNISVLNKLLNSLLGITRGSFMRESSYDGTHAVVLVEHLKMVT